jgi:hypothetical protein
MDPKLYLLLRENFFILDRLLSKVNCNLWNFYRALVSYFFETDHHKIAEKMLNQGVIVSVNMDNLPEIDAETLEDLQYFEKDLIDTGIDAFNLILAYAICKLRTDQSVDFLESL